MQVVDIAAGAVIAGIALLIAKVLLPPFWFKRLRRWATARPPEVWPGLGDFRVRFRNIAVPFDVKAGRVIAPLQVEYTGNRPVDCRFTFTLHGENAPEDFAYPETTTATVLRLEPGAAADPDVQCRPPPEWPDARKIGLYLKTVEIRHPGRDGDPWPIRLQPPGLLDLPVLPATPH